MDFCCAQRYTSHTEEREITYTETDEDGETVTKTKTVTYTIFTVKFAGEEIFADKVFHLDLEQKAQVRDFAENLSMFLYDDSTSIALETHGEIGQASQGGGLPDFEGEFGNPFPGVNWLVSSPFGKRPYPGVGTGTNNHTGMDITADLGTPIHAVESGTVLFVKDSGNRGYGKHVAIDHGNGIVTLYAHCSKILVTPGQSVAKGDVIAEVGGAGWSTGNHLHVEVIVNGTAIDPYPLISNG